MAKEKQTPIYFDGQEYIFEKLSPQQQVFVNHIHDLDRKISSARFNLDQLNVGQQAYMSALKKDLAVTKALKQVEADDEAKKTQAPKEPVKRKRGKKDAK